MTDFSRLEEQLGQVALMVDSLKWRTGTGNQMSLLTFPRASCFLPSIILRLGFYFET